MSRNRKILMVTGVLATLFGALIFSARAKVASVVLGANVAFGMGVVEADATKIGIVGLVSAVMFIAGLVLAIVGFLKSEKPKQEN